jgi:hypothetical protein
VYRLVGVEAQLIEFVGGFYRSLTTTSCFKRDESQVINMNEINRSEELAKLSGAETAHTAPETLAAASKIELIEDALLKNIGGGSCYLQTCYLQTCYLQTCYLQTCYLQTCYLGNS